MKKIGIPLLALIIAISFAFSTKKNDAKLSGYYWFAIDQSTQTWAPQLNPERTYSDPFPCYGIIDLCSAAFDNIYYGGGGLYYPDGYQVFQHYRY